MLKKRLITRADYGTILPTGTYSGERINSAVVNGKICFDDSNAHLEHRLYLCPKDMQFGNHPQVIGGEESFWSTERKPPLWNDCVHTKQNATFSKPYGYIRHGLTGWPGLNITTQPCHRFAWVTPVHNTRIPGGFEIDEFFRSRAMASMMPRFESDFQALNFLFELKDFKEAVQALGKLVNPNSKFWDSISNWNVRFSDAILYGDPVKPKSPSAKRPRNYDRSIGLTAAEVYADKATSAAAKSWLTYTMAYLPLMKDLAAYTAAAATEYQEALSKYKEKGTTPNTRHYSEVLSNQSAIVTSSWQGDYFSGIRHDDYVRATANLQYKYGYVLSDQSEAFARYWGLTGTLEEFWNMLPFSFLVDYFCKVGQALRLTQIDKNLEMNPLQYCESLLHYSGTSAVVRPGYSWTCSHHIDGKILDPQSTKWVAVNGSYSSHYQRWVRTVPKQGLIVPLIKMPSVRQNWNMLALAKVLLF